MATDFLKDNLNESYNKPTPSLYNKGMIKGYNTNPAVRRGLGTEEYKRTTAQDVANYLASGFGFSIKHSESEAKSMLKILLKSNNAENDEAYANLVAKLTNMIESYKITSTIESEA